MLDVTVSPLAKRYASRARACSRSSRHLARTTCAHGRRRRGPDWESPAAGRASSRACPARAAAHPWERRTASRRHRGQRPPRSGRRGRHQVREEHVRSRNDLRPAQGCWGPTRVPASRHARYGRENCPCLMGQGPHRRVACAHGRRTDHRRYRSGFRAGGRTRNRCDHAPYRPHTVDSPGAAACRAVRARR